MIIDSVQVPPTDAARAHGKRVCGKHEISGSVVYNLNTSGYLGEVVKPTT